MHRLTNVSRLGRAVCELAIRSRSQMPFCVTPASTDPRLNSYMAVQDVGRALGYAVVGCSLTLNPGATVSDFGRRISEDLSRASGPTLILLHAGLYDGGATHQGIVRGLSHLSSESWSVNGETHLMVLSPEDPAPLARLIGEELGNRDWAAAIPL